MNLQEKELLALQALDTELGQLATELQGLDRGERVERALAQRKAKQLAAEKRLANLESEQRASELELKALEEKKHHESRRLYEGRITATRELQALQMEVGSLERQRQRLDDQILRRMEEITTARATGAATTEASGEAERALKVMRRRYDRESSRIQGLIAAKQPERDKIASRVTPDVLRRYEEIRRRNHNIAAVRIQNGACGGCRMKVGSNVYRRMQTQDSYVFCESCSRYLFLPEEDAT